MKHYFIKACTERMIIARENSGLFFGLTLFLLGLLNFSRGKYCDGNPADYYSCTNPSAYYYYSPLAVALCIIGAFCIAFWRLKNGTKK